MNPMMGEVSISKHSWSGQTVGQTAATGSPALIYCSVSNTGSIKSKGPNLPP